VNISYEIGRLCTFDLPRPAIVELGAGTGHLARVLTLAFGTANYVIFDIPETLFFSFLFLRLNFPEAKTLYVNSSDRLSKEELARYDFVFVPTLFADAVLDGSFDLFVNTASLGEMRNEVIRHWMDFVQNRLDVQHLFTLNRYLNTIAARGGNHNFRLEENEAAVHYDAGWEIRNWEVEPSFTRCPFVDTIIARYVEIVAKRVGTTLIDERRAAAMAALEGVVDQDWLRLEATPAVMSARDNILVNDTTINGALFKLWDGLRYLPTDAAIVGLMLRYLETLTRANDAQFEEVYYYEDLFERLAANNSEPWAVTMLSVIHAKRAWRRQAPQPPPAYAPPPTGGRPLDLPYADEYTDGQPHLVQSDRNGFNIVEFRGTYFGLLQGLGPLDLAGLTHAHLQGLEAQRQCVISPTLEGCRQRIDALVAQQD
jgi:hypothetical protein